MTREELEKRRIERSIAILENALACCREENAPRAMVFAALQFLEMRAKEKWPFEQFRQALNGDPNHRFRARGALAGAECFIGRDHGGDDYLS